MYTSTDLTIFDTLHLDIEILAEVLKLSQELVFWVEFDVLNDTPELGKSVARAEETIQLTHSVMEKIEEAVKDGDIAKLRQANYILDDAEELLALGAWPKNELLVETGIRRRQLPTICSGSRTKPNSKKN